MKKWIILISLLLMITILSGCGCEHQWIDATCVTPKTCALCQITEGGPSEHKWQDATCLDPQTCSVCKITEGIPLSHSPGEFVTSLDCVNAIEYTTQSCSACGTLLESSERNTSLIQDGTYRFSEEEFIHRLNHIYSELGRKDMNAELEPYTTDDNELSNICVIRCDGTILASITFTEKDEYGIGSVCLLIAYPQIGQQTLNETSNTSLEDFDDYYWLYEDYTIYEDAICPIILACDPTISYSEAANVLKYAWDVISDPYSEDLFITLTCGELEIEFENLFFLLLSQMAIISPAE